MHTSSNEANHPLWIAKMDAELIPSLVWAMQGKLFHGKEIDETAGHESLSLILEHVELVIP